MNNQSFVYEKLNSSEKKAYDSMNEVEKKKFEQLWVTLNSKEEQLKQYLNLTKVKCQKRKKEYEERERKERTHRLIERGAIVESYIENATDFSNEQFKAIISRALNNYEVKRYIETTRETIGS